MIFSLGFLIIVDVLKLKGFINKNPKEVTISKLKLFFAFSKKLAFQLALPLNNLKLKLHLKRQAIFIAKV